jgi:hypothetical protein
VLDGGVLGEPVDGVVDGVVGVAGLAAGGVVVVPAPEPVVEDVVAGGVEVLLAVLVLVPPQ